MIHAALWVASAIFLFVVAVLALFLVLALFGAVAVFLENCWAAFLAWDRRAYEREQARKGGAK